MTTRRKTFKAGTKMKDFSPVEFELNDETFHCVSAIQGAVLLEFVARADGDSGGAAANALYGFFEDVMDESEYKRFREYLKNPDLIIDLETIGEIAAWLVEEYSARPTVEPASSPNGRSTSGQRSTVGAS